jgi:hypothetical protein
MVKVVRPEHEVHVPLLFDTDPMFTRQDAARV